MRRSICFCEPSVALAGQKNKWKFIYTSSVNLPEGAKLRFDIGSKGRDIDWVTPQSGPSGKSNVIYGHLDDGKALHPEEVELEDSYAPVFDFTLPKAVKEGEVFTIVLGPPKTSKKPPSEDGNVSQHNTQRRRPFMLYIDPKGEGRFDDPEIFLIDIRGNKLDHIRVITPSIVQKNKRFDVTIRFEDAFGNLTSNADPDTLIELSYEGLRENLNWRIFVPETGFITLPNLYFNEEGVYTIQLKNLKTEAVFRSAPIRCVNESAATMFWGALHGESERVDSAENIENAMRHFRDERAYNFFASSCFEDEEETPNDIWKLVAANIAEFNEGDRFVGMLGFQWKGKNKSEGLRQIIHYKDNKSLMRKSESKFNSLKKIYRGYTPGDLISIPCFTMGGGMSFDFSNFEPEFERVVEIYNAWGSSECTKKQGNPFPIRSEDQSGVKEDATGSVIEALNKNHRFGFVSGGLDDRGCYWELFDSSQVQYSPGLTAIVSKDFTREALMKALYNRACYATTGERIILDFSIAGYDMGHEGTTADKPGLRVNRHISGFAAGTADLSTIEIIRNGEAVHTIEPTGYSCNFEFDDLCAIESVALSSPDKRPDFVYYYVRVTQKDGHRAWSSPIWINVEAKPKKKQAEKASPSTK